jgi:ParB/RepB/Spo0J family partition protein
MTLPKIEELSVDQIVTSKSQARLADIEKDIDDLALHISVHGLLEPIIVFKNQSGKYELLAGQRRFIACSRMLKWSKIPAIIRNPPANDEEAKALSLGENLTQVPMTLDDIITACETLFKRYGTEKKVAEKCGISPKTVKKYVKFARLPQELKDAYDKGQIPGEPRKALDSCLKAVDGLNYEHGGDVPISKVIEFAKKLATKTAGEANDMVTEAQNDPSRPVTEIEKDSTKPKKMKKRILILSSEDDDKLVEYAEKGEQPSPEDAALGLVVEGLRQAGF